MSAAAGPLGPHAARLARTLHRDALRTFRELTPAAMPPLYPPLDAFLAQPTPSHYLAAARCLAAARRDARQSHSHSALAKRSFARGIERLRALPFVDASVPGRLSHLPVDSCAGQRLCALAALLEAHQELAARVRKEPASIAPPPNAPAQ